MLGTLRLGSSPAARHEIRPALLARLREAHPGIAVDASEATTGNLCRELLSRRLDVALGFCTEPVPGLARRTLLHERDVRADAARAPLAGAASGAGRAARATASWSPAEGLNAGFNRRLRLLCREHGFEPRTVVAGSIWEDAEWPPGDDVVALATERVARNAGAAHAHGRRSRRRGTMPLELVWREDDDSPRRCGRFLELATPAPEPAPDRERRQQALQQRADRERVEDRAEADGAAEREADGEDAELDARADLAHRRARHAHEAGHQPVARARAEAARRCRRRRRPR